MGSECSTTRPSRTEWRLAAASTRPISPSVTAPPASSISATKRSLPRRPPESDTTTDSSCTLAMLSAMSMAWRTIASTSTRSTTPPAFMPLAAVWAKPRTRTPWLRRRSTSCGACGSSRAIRQAILLVPISRPATTAARRGDTGFILGVRPKRSTVMRHFLGLGLFCLLGRLERLIARRRGGIGLPYRDAIAQPQIDRHDVARQQFFGQREFDQCGQRLRGLALGKKHFDAVFQMQVPAPLGDQNRGLDRLRDRRIALEQTEKILRRMLGAIADHPRQRGEALRHVAFQHGAVGGDQCKAAVLLPQRERLALLDLDA